MSSLSGYETEFVDPPKELQYSCSICLCILREPQLVNCCGNSFCLECILPIISNHTLKCPLCKGNPKPLTPDKRLNRDLSQKDVYCQFRDNCSWIGRLADFDQHMNLEPKFSNCYEGCAYAVINCKYCKQKSVRKELKDHENDCPKRPYTCEHCRKFTSVKSELIKHYDTCSMYLIECTNECSEKLPRFRLKSHLATECLYTTVNCDFHFAGCDAWLMRRDMKDHLIKHAKDHADMSLKENNLLTLDVIRYRNCVSDNLVLLEQKEILITENEKLECELENLSRELEEISHYDEARRRHLQEIEKLKSELKQKDSVMKVHVAASTSLKEKISGLEAQLDEAVMEVTKKESLLEGLQHKNQQLQEDFNDKDEELEEACLLVDRYKDENTSLKDELSHLQLELEKRDRIITEMDKKLKSSPRRTASACSGDKEEWPDYTATEFSPYDDGSQEDVTPIPFTTIFYKEREVPKDTEEPRRSPGLPSRKVPSDGDLKFGLSWSQVLSRRKPQAPPIRPQATPTKPQATPIKQTSIPRPYNAPVSTKTPAKGSPKVPCKLMIRNTPSKHRGVTDRDIINLFSRFGRVYSINRNGSNTAVVYDNLTSVQDGVVASERRALELGGIILNCNYEKK